MNEALAILDRLRSAEVSFELDGTELVFAPRTPKAAIVEEWSTWLKIVAAGRITGHAPATCTLCGAVAMISIVNSGGTRRGRKSSPWPSCRLCFVRNPSTGRNDSRLHGRMVIAEDDFAGVARIRPIATPRPRREPPSPSSPWWPKLPTAVAATLTRIECGAGCGRLTTSDRPLCWWCNPLQLSAAELERIEVARQRRLELIDADEEDELG